MPLSKLSREVFFCDCPDRDHMIFIETWHDQDSAEGYISIHLRTHASFFKRLLTSFRYLLKREVNYSPFVDFVINVETAQKMIRKLEEIKEFEENQESSK